MDSPATVLFRCEPHSHDAEEMEIARKYFNVVNLRTECPSGLVVGRYSVLPYYKELCMDLADKGVWLINRDFQHYLISSFRYYDFVKDYTFETWDDATIRYCDYPGPFVVKGRTNSRKHQWRTKMFAPTRRDALMLGSELAADPLLGPQGIIYRRYEPLESFGEGINGMIFANEWRFFCLNSRILAHGYYWSILDDDACSQLVIEPEGYKFAQKMADILAEYLNFFVVDVAKTVEGKWRLVEVNDAQMSGLSCVDPNILYPALKEALDMW